MKELYSDIQPCLATRRKQTHARRLSPYGRQCSRCPRRGSSEASASPPRPPLPVLCSRLPGSVKRTLGRRNRTKGIIMERSFNVEQESANRKANQNEGCVKTVHRFREGNGDQGYRCLRGGEKYTKLNGKPKIGYRETSNG